MRRRTRGRAGAVLVLILALALLAGACGDDSGGIFGLPEDTATTGPQDATTPTAPQPEPTAPQPEPTAPQPEPTAPQPEPTVTTTSTTTTLPQAELRPWATAIYDEFDLTSPILPDPWEYEHPTSAGVGAGSDAVDVGYLGGACYGWAGDAPDFEITYTAGSWDLLRFYFVADSADGDAVMIVNDPSGNWHCSDDSYGTYNPTVDFPFPASGVYDIWLGSYDAGDLVPGSFFVTEIDGNHP
jgi:hypothetical protein